MAICERNRAGSKPKVYTRIYCSVLGHADSVTSFENIRASQLGQFITIKGTVVRMSPCRLVCTSLTYVCDLCKAVKVIETEDGVLSYPGPCSGRCRGYKWSPQVNQSICEEVQLVKLQESIDKFDDSGDAAHGGGMNRVVEVELRAPLLETATVGDCSCFSGLLVTRRSPNAKNSSSQQICLLARSVQSLRSRGALRDGAVGPDSLESTWSMAERGRYFEMARQPQWFERLVHSLAPALFGMETLKEAVLLSILGGTPRFRGLSRSNIHMLMVGDPGLGKSQLLKAACNVAPRSAFVCAHNSSSCGLTVTLSRDPVSNEVTFEAGAVVHGDGGITCIDEIDKTGGEFKALLEVMEQESVSIAKAGLVFSMPVHTSVLAAGNPVGGHFDLSKPLSANINLSPALLSRFDILVCLRDVKSGNTNHLTKHVLKLHQQKGANQENQAGVLSSSLVQSFISFARETCFPVLSSDACNVLKDCYLQKRARLAQGQSVYDEQPAGSEGEIPFTPRYLYALIRVAEARAKVELRSEVTVADAQYAVGLLEECRGTFLTQDLQDQPTSGGPKRKKNQKDQVIDILKGEIIATGNNSFSHPKIISVCEEVGCKNPNATLHQLNEFGFLLQRGDKYILRDC
ncbi:minichromosome maintenance protein 8 [Angomonas deanei]|uniref:MCM OB domain/MCM P-loop domain/AAA domain (Dynein-related subfamily)/MCM AAA-lid domain containing protein, putative n=1 Tax=Angomonas deanei TaxID=59799 RepID=A0A7G2CT82_9TRYP|nr:minichromosome maintenance protein 8 [Angomonas deanei]CAD2222489.1 MCM OB domain/MCM P-loop domain/AAA domain (dynein-related subfamily)/MCM AAA-lid domain containing protein, putative [Angomonas deanei]|eukprot:EPY41700.1 minichromosome maintenance protein 8 [Angomonas deanei]